MGRTDLVAEIGANHNGSFDVCMEMVRSAFHNGADYVKFQKRDVDLAIPEAQKGVLRETPWGILPYIEYRKRLEFGEAEYDILDTKTNAWFASVWDIPSAELMTQYKMPFVKIPSAKITDLNLLRWVAANYDCRVVISTGMSTMEEVHAAVRILPDCTILHCNSTYPAENDELNLMVIGTLQREFPSNPIGYSGHERGIAPSVAAVALGACMVERHFTLDRSMWGTDQAASLEPTGFARMAKDIRVIEQALGDGEKRVYKGEEDVRRKLRGESAGVVT